MKTLKTIVILVLFLFSANSYAQDIIVKTNQDTIFCKIKNVGSIEIKYVLPDYPEDVSFGIDIEKIRKVVFANGKEMKFTKDMNNPDNYADNRKNAIKFHLYSPLAGSITAAYERSLKPGRSMEFSLGYIFGMPSDFYQSNDKGVIFRAGFKFMRSPDFYFNKMRYSHVLKGSYFKPELVFNSFSTQEYNHYSGKYGSTTNVTSLSILFNIGKQVVYDNLFLIDYYVGFGYGLTNNNDVGYYYSNTIIDANNIPMSFTTGFKIGFLYR